ncbi:OadG family protein [Halopseudomonas xiamenensis]|uniref:OadG family protein n=1 Tax=Halopseudomonas xiamenensis TaxID=157792 RepID=UPI00162609BF|nr:OadG family protein [Halopseudomonas xiamenensis]
MSSTELLMEGVELMLMGMGAVFVFLMLLIGCINLMSWLVIRFVPEEVPVTAAPRQVPVPAAVPVEPELLAAIGAAVRLHRAKRAVS